MKYNKIKYKISNLIYTQKIQSQTKKIQTKSSHRFTARTFHTLEKYLKTKFNERSSTNLKSATRQKSLDSPMNQPSSIVTSPSLESLESLIAIEPSSAEETKGSDYQCCAGGRWEKSVIARSDNRRREPGLYGGRLYGGRGPINKTFVSVTINMRCLLADRRKWPTSAGIGANLDRDR